MSHWRKRAGSVVGLLLLALAACAREPAGPLAAEPAARPAGDAPRAAAVGLGAPEAPRNLLLLTLDTTRADRLGSYGHEEAATPNLDALATRGARFEQAIAPVALTRPSHATLFTGQLPQTHGVWSNGPYRLEPSWGSLPVWFQRAGFDTGAVVASFVLARTFGFETGFALFDDSTREIEAGDPEKTADEVARIASRWLGGELAPPFFLWAHFYDPHVPYTPPEPFASRLPADPYDGEIAFMDHAIGEILARLEHEGWLAETLVVAVADHGEGLGEHDETTHGYFLYDNTVRVPLILAGPGVPAGLVVEGQVTLADVAPTLLEAFGLEPGGAELDGRSFWRELGAGTVAGRPALIENRAIHDQYGWAALSGLRSGGWKWLRAPQSELYDLAADPGESRNLAASHRRRAAELRGEWSRLRRTDARRASGGLSAEEERKLAALGYLAARPTGQPERGVDPKQVAGVIGDIEALIVARRAGRSEEAGALVETILETDPTNLFALRVQAQQLLAARDYRAAAAILERIVEGHETHPETLSDLAEAYERLDRPGDALRLYQQATTPPWIHWPALQSLARIAARRPDLLAREELLAKLGAFEPPAGRERLALARAYAMVAERRFAEAWFRRAIEAEPGLVEARVGLAQMLTRLGRHDEALTNLAEIDPPTVESVFVEGTVLAALGRGEEACESFSFSMSLGPENANLLFLLGRSLARCGASDLARQALRRTLEREPGYAEALYELAGLERAAGRMDEARRLLEQFVATAPPRLEQARRDAEAQLRQLGG